MTYIVLFKDNPDADPDIRKTHMAAHLAFLESHGDQVTAAGPLADRDGGAAGGLWVVEADSVEAVEELVHADPFWPTGLRQDISILTWTKVFAEGTRRV